MAKSKAQRRLDSEAMLRGYIVSLHTLFGVTRDELITMVDEELDSITDEEPAGA